MARAGEWVLDALHGQVPEHPTNQAAGTEYFSLDVEDVLAAGSRPDRLAGVRPQERVQRHTEEQIGDSVPFLPSLDAPVPQTVEQLPDILRFFDTLMPDPEQVIDVPKIFLEDIPMRTLVREPQLAEQLVEVPTILYFLKQIVDIPVPRGRGCRLQGFSEQNPTALTFQYTVENFKVYSQDRVPQHLPLLTLQLLLMTWMTRFKFFFALFSD